MTYQKIRFSLIELLIVISILAILFSLLSPTLERTIQGAYQVSCASNQKNLGISLHIYADDHHDLFVPIYQINDKKRIQSWKTSLINQQYAEADGSTLVCTSEPDRNSYGMNMEPYPSGSFRSTIDRPVIRYRLSKPGSHIFGADATTTIFYKYRSNPEGPLGWLNLKEDAFRTVAYRHIQNCNAFFFDGHSESLPMLTFWNKVDELLNFEKEAIKMD